MSPCFVESWICIGLVYIIIENSLLEKGTTMNISFEYAHLFIRIHSFNSQCVNIHKENPTMEIKSFIHLFILSNKINIVPIFEVTNIDEQIKYEMYDERNSQNAREKCLLDWEQIYLLENGKNNLWWLFYLTCAIK